MFNAKTGRYDGISSAYRMKLVPVFVVDPDKPMGIPDRESEAGRKKAFDDTAAAMIKAVDTLVPQEYLPGAVKSKWGGAAAFHSSWLGEQSRRNQPGTDNSAVKPTAP